MLAQLVRASVCGTEGRRFESGTSPSYYLKKVIQLDDLFFDYLSKNALLKISSTIFKQDHLITNI